MIILKGFLGAFVLLIIAVVAVAFCFLLNFIIDSFNTKKEEKAEDEVYAMAKEWDNKTEGFSEIENNNIPSPHWYTSDAEKILREGNDTKLNRLNFLRKQRGMLPLSMWDIYTPVEYTSITGSMSARDSEYYLAAYRNIELSNQLEAIEKRASLIRKRTLHKVR